MIFFYNEAEQPKPVVVYAHGFNGFKDSGITNLLSSKFAETRIEFVTFNFHLLWRCTRTPAYYLLKWLAFAVLFTVDNIHAFGSTHPWL